MGMTTGFMEYPRTENPYRDARERLQDFNDLHTAQPADARRCQAGRCMDCGVPFCQSDFGCPLHNLIPEWNDLLYQGQEKEALERLLLTAPFPEFIGRVCPALCEKACNLADDGVTNRDNELYLIETGFAKDWIQPRLPAVRTGKKIAVVGSGPAGLAAAGFIGCEEETLSRFSLAADGRGRLLYKDGSHHLGGKLFSAGDMRNGQSLVVRALADGRSAAKEIHEWLRGMKQ